VARRSADVVRLVGVGAAIAAAVGLAVIGLGG